MIQIVTIFVVLTVAVLGLITGFRFTRDRRAARLRLMTGSQVIETRRGPVEYAIVGDRGPVVLLLHGGIGGWDQGVALGVDLLSRDATHPDYRQTLDEGADLLAEPFRLVAPSRVGYLRTPLETGRTPAEGADALALVTEWHIFRRPDFRKLREVMAGHALFDGRNVWNPVEVRALEFKYYGIGRSPGCI